MSNTKLHMAQYIADYIREEQDRGSEQSLYEIIMEALDAIEGGACEAIGACEIVLS